MVGRQSSISERRYISRFQRIVELNHAARASLKVLRVAAVGVNARESTCFTMDVVAESASTAEPACHKGMQDDLVADLEPSHGIANLVDPACVFMADSFKKVRVTPVITVSYGWEG
jgi:hypothetical protein